MSKIPSMPSKQLTKLLEKGGAKFVRQRGTDHAIYSRYVNERRYSAHSDFVLLPGNHNEF